MVIQLVGKGSVDMNGFDAAEMSDCALRLDCIMPVPADKFKIIKQAALGMGQGKCGLQCVTRLCRRNEIRP